MIRLGIVDFDTSHVVQFTRRLNHVDIDQEQWVDGAQVVAGCPGSSAILEQEKIDEYAATVRGYGVELVDRPEDLIGRVDGILVESVDGSVHLERARPFIEAGLPVYVDKPFACCLSEAAEMVRLARNKGLPIFSASSLRYGIEVQEVIQNEESNGRVLGADAYSPAGQHPRNPGLFHYGIHGVETLFTLMGPGCDSVSCQTTEDADVVIGRWRDGRLGTMRGTRAGAHAYGFTAFCEKAVVSSSINAGYIYRELLRRIVEMFATGEAPLDVTATLEIVAFIEAASQSAANGGAVTPLPRIEI